MLKRTASTSLRPGSVLRGSNSRSTWSGSTTAAARRLAVLVGGAAHPLRSSRPPRGWSGRALVPAGVASSPAPSSTLVHHPARRGLHNQAASVEDGEERADGKQPWEEDAPGPKARPPVRLASGAAMVPHPQKQHKGGEDAYFVSEDGQVLGVADGVGGWAQSGVDPGLYSKRLMAEAKKAVESAKKSGVRPARPTDILQKAYDRTKDLVGSSTAVILIAEDRAVKYSNLGDSGFMVIRGDKVAFRTREQTHAFNTPYQIGTGGDHPSDAEEGKVDLEEGDVIVVGTDGLFDNLFDHEIVDLVVKGRSYKKGPEELAEAIARQAHQVGSKMIGKTPFGQNAGKYGLRYEGGKLDDITVVVCLVSAVPPASAASPAAPSSPPQMAKF